jgi:hypothetical protein
MSNLEELEEEVSDISEIDYFAIPTGLSHQYNHVLLDSIHDKSRKKTKE